MKHFHKLENLKENLELLRGQLHGYTLIVNSRLLYSSLVLMDGLNSLM